MFHTMKTTAERASASQYAMPNFTTDWYLADWMRTLNLRNADLERLSGWDKRKVSFLVTGRQPFARDTLIELARCMNIAPFELLLHPDDAMELRRFRSSALALAADTRRSWAAEPMPEPLPSSKTAS